MRFKKCYKSFYIEDIKSILLCFFDIEKVDKIFSLLSLPLLSMLSWFTIFINNFEIVNEVIELVLCIQRKSLTILPKLKMEC